MPDCVNRRDRDGLEPKQPARASTTGSTVEPDAFDLLERETNVVGSASAGDPFLKFIKADPFEIKLKTALQWWIEHREDYPRQLSKMAINLLCIPAMSAEPERLFSGARRQIPWTRAKLSGKLVEQMECLKYWLTKQVLKNVRVEISEQVLEDTACESNTEAKGGDGEVIVQ